MSRTFKDTEGREWEIRVNCDTLSRVKELTKADLAGIGDGSLLAQLDADPLLSGEVLWAICKPVADSRSIDRASFLSGIDGDVGEVAGEALSREIVNFSKKDLRPMLTNILDKAKRMRAAAIGAMNRNLDATVGGLEKEMLAKLDLPPSKSGDSSGDAQESAASIQVNLPSGS